MIEEVLITSGRSSFSYLRDCRQQFAWVLALPDQDIGRIIGVDRFRRGRIQEYFDSWAASANLRHGFDPAHYRHPVVENDEVGLQELRLTDGFLAVRALSDDHQPRRREKFAQDDANRIAIVYDQHPLARVPAGATTLRGRRHPVHGAAAMTILLIPREMQARDITGRHCEPRPHGRPLRSATTSESVRSGTRSSLVAVTEYAKYRRWCSCHLSPLRSWNRIAGPWRRPSLGTTARGPMPAGRRHGPWARLIQHQSNAPLAPLGVSPSLNVSVSMHLTV